MPERRSSQAPLAPFLHPLLVSHYIPLEQIGQGGYGTVFSVTVKQSARVSRSPIYAVKLIPKSKLPAHRMIKVKFGGDFNAGQPVGPGVAAYGESICMVPIEAYALRRVQHEGVVEFIDLFEDAVYFYLVQEYHGSKWLGGDRDLLSPLEGLNLHSGSSTPPASPVVPFSPFFPRSSTDLFQCLEEHRVLPEDVSRFVFEQLVETVLVLLEHGICHCDIKDQNVLIDHNWKVKLVDFGAAMLFEPSSSFNVPLVQGHVGTRRFSAPEVLMGHLQDPSVSDVWSLGIVLCVLLTGDSPFRTDAAILDPACPPLPRRKMTPLARDLMGRMLERDVKKRIKLEDISRHPWLRLRVSEFKGTGLSDLAK